MSEAQTWIYWKVSIERANLRLQNQSAISPELRLEAMELVCPAGNLPSLKAAVDNGADAVYIGFRDETNARHFAGLNFNDKQIEQGLAYARSRGTKVYVAINTYPQPANIRKWEKAVDQAADYGVDALILADIGVMDYAAEKWPELRLHLSVQGSATTHEAVRFYAEQFGVQRAVIPRVLSVKQVEFLVKDSPIPIEVFGFGSLCIMAEGRCYLSSYLTGESPNTQGVCSPASFVQREDKGDVLESRLNGLLIDRFKENENAGYPTLCKGRFEVEGKIEHALEEPTSLNTMNILPELMEAGVAALKVEGRQRSPAYVATVTKAWRTAIDLAKQKNSTMHQESLDKLAALAEGKQTTIGAYERSWQ